MTQLLNMQQLLYADAQSDSVQGAKRAMITRAWKELEELRLRMIMRPPPKPADAAELKRAQEKLRASRAKAHDPGWRPSVVGKPGGPGPTPPPAQEQGGGVA